MPKCLQMRQFCMFKVKEHNFRARKPLNLAKVGVANHKVGGASHKVGGAAPHHLFWKLHPCLTVSWCFVSLVIAGTREPGGSGGNLHNYLGCFRSVEPPKKRWTVNIVHLYFCFCTWTWVPPQKSGEFFVLFLGRGYLGVETPGDVSPPPYV